MSAAIFEKIREELPHNCQVEETSWNGGALIYGLVAVKRPKLAIEIGAQRGTTTAYMAKALSELMYGELVAYELVPSRCAESIARLDEVWPNGPWSVKEGDFFKMYDGRAVDFCFLDIDPKESYIPAYELVRFQPGALLVAHDMTHPFHLPNLEKLHERLVSDGWDTFTIDQERGFLLATKRS